MSTARIGQSVVFQLGESDSPLGHRVGTVMRQFPALVVFLGPEDSRDIVDLVVFPLYHYGHCYKTNVPRGEPHWTEACWFPVS